MFKSLKSYLSSSNTNANADSKSSCPEVVTANVAEREDVSIGESTEAEAATSSAGAETSSAQKQGQTSKLASAFKADEVGQTISKARNFLGKLGTAALQKTTQVLEGNAPIISDFSREQDKFKNDKQQLETLQRQNSAVPWQGYANEDAVKKQVLALSLDKRNFIRNPPNDSMFVFDLTEYAGAAKTMLAEDPQLAKMRFELVPKAVKEDLFWRNYFYRISLIKQSAQRSEFASSPASNNDTSGDNAAAVSTESVGASMPPSSSETQKDPAVSATVNRYETNNADVVGADFISESLAQNITLSSWELEQLKLEKPQGDSSEKSNLVTQTRTNLQQNKPNATDELNNKKSDDTASSASPYGSDAFRDEFELVPDTSAVAQSGGSNVDASLFDDDLEREILAEIAREAAQAKQ